MSTFTLLEDPEIVFGNAFHYSGSVNGMTMEYELNDKIHSISTEGYNFISMKLGE